MCRNIPYITTLGKKWLAEFLDDHIPIPTKISQPKYNGYQGINLISSKTRSTSDTCEHRCLVFHLIPQLKKRGVNTETVAAHIFIHNSDFNDRLCSIMILKCCGFLTFSKYLSYL